MWSLLLVVKTTELSDSDEYVVQMVGVMKQKLSTDNRNVDKSLQEVVSDQQHQSDGWFSTIYH